MLPEAFGARDPERMARFQREAEVLASLNHPNIAAIYGVEERALVMELVEGNSPKGPLSFDDAWHTLRRRWPRRSSTRMKKASSIAT